MILTAPQLWTPRWWRLPRRIGELAAMSGGHLCLGSGNHLKRGADGHLTTNCTPTPPQCLNCNNCSGTQTTTPCCFRVTFSGITTCTCFNGGNVNLIFLNDPNGIYDAQFNISCNWILNRTSGDYGVLTDPANCSSGVSTTHGYSVQVSWASLDDISIRLNAGSFNLFSTASSPTPDSSCKGWTGTRTYNNSNVPPCRYNDPGARLAYGGTATVALCPPP